MTEKVTQPNRISVIDSLRGFAVFGIIMIHFLEHMNFYAFPEITHFDQAVWDTVFFLGSSKMYAIFALLFGFSCYIQHHNQETRGKDFRLRFLWRMILLFLWGMTDLLFFNGDILVTYAIMGLFLIPLVKASNKVLIAVALILFLQPVEIVYMILAAANPSVTPMNLGLGEMWGLLFTPCAEGGILDVARVNHQLGVQLNMGWALENGRLEQTLYLFIIGMYLGRKRLFLDEGNNMQFWKRVLFGSLAAFAVLLPLWMYLPGAVENRTISTNLGVILNMWKNFAMMSFYVSGITLLFYRTRAMKALDHLKYVGKMSLSCYLIQSIVGALLFYNWGFGLFRVSGHTLSLLLSFAFLFCLYWFCRFWTKRHRRGPLEEIWSRTTFIGSN